MPLSDQIEALYQRATAAGVAARRFNKVRLYGEGIKAKVQQADLALYELEQLAGRSDTIETTTDASFLIEARVNFYCDAFWAFLYASLDVLAQVLNQAYDFRESEDRVSIKHMRNEVSQRVATRGSRLATEIDRLCRSHAFTNLARYRNCSLHRRQIYIEEAVTTMRRTAGYGATTTSSPMESVRRTICDDPLVLSPRTIQNRRVPEYLTRTRDSVYESLVRVVRQIDPV